MADLHAALGQPVATPEPSLDTGLHRLEFAGEAVLRSAARRQEERFLEVVARLRPDLRATIAERWGVLPGVADRSLELLGGGSDLWLHGQIWPVGEQEIGGRVHADAVEVMYLVDLGVQQEVDEGGDLLASVRSYMDGTTVFVPDVGPVACIERHVFAGSGLFEEPSQITESRCVRVP